MKFSKIKMVYAQVCIVIHLCAYKRKPVTKMIGVSSIVRKKIVK